MGKCRRLEETVRRQMSVERIVSEMALSEEEVSDGEVGRNVSVHVEERETRG